MEEGKITEEKDVKFDFTLDEYNYFCEKCLFTPELKEVLDYRIKGMSIVAIAMEMNLSESTIKRYIKKIKIKILRVIK